MLTGAQMVLPAAGSSRWRMGGLGFGLPLSRLYARYFGVLPCGPLSSCAC